MILLKTGIKRFIIIGICTKIANMNRHVNNYEVYELSDYFIKESIVKKIPNIVKEDKIPVYCIYTMYENGPEKECIVIIGCIVTDLSEIPEGMIGMSGMRGHVKNSKGEEGKVEVLTISQ